VKKLVLGIYLAFVGVVSAQIPANSCTEIPGFYPCDVVWSGYAGSEVLWKPGEDRFVVAFSRLQADVLGPGTSHVAFRVDVSASPDGDDTTKTSASFQTLEARVAIYAPISAQISLMGIGGANAPLLSMDGVSLRYPYMYGGGFLLGHPRSRTWLFLGAGADQAAGPGLKLLFAGQVRLRANTYLVFDGSMGGRGAYARNGSALGTAN
jgi:hypothetical protein